MKTSENVIICDICGCIVEDDTNWAEIDGTVYCEQCFEKAKEEDDVKPCAVCGEYHEYDNLLWVSNIGKYVCEDCFNDDGDFYYCLGSEEYYYDTYNGGNFTCPRSWAYQRIEMCGDYYCREWLIDNDYRECSDCGEWMHID